MAFIARSLSYCVLQTRRNTFLITITRSCRAISRISRTSHRVCCDRASGRSLHPRGDDQEASYVLDIFNVSQRFRRISYATNGSFNPLPSHSGSALLTSYRVNSRGVWNLFWQASLVCARANVKRSKMNG